MAQAEDNRETFRKFIDLFFVQKNVRAAFEQYVSPNYRQHNPLIADGRDAAVEFVSGFFESMPEMIIDVRRMGVDGDLCWVHSHFRFTPDDRGMVVADIFRFENGRAVEHWDVAQPIPEEARNDNGMI